LPFFFTFFEIFFRFKKKQPGTQRHIVGGTQVLRAFPKKTCKECVKKRPGTWLHGNEQLRADFLSERMIRLAEPPRAIERVVGFTVRPRESGFTKIHLNGQPPFVCFK
jgi:hypothetical protein